MPCFDWDKEGDTLCFSLGDTTVSFWSSAEGPSSKPSAVENGTKEPTTCVAWSKTGSLVFEMLILQNLD